MKYWRYEKAGIAADVLQIHELETPVPGPGEVRVKIANSAVNPTDCKRRQVGRELARFAHIIPNNDGSGVIDAVGNGVEPARVGERVWIFGAQAGRPMGTAAEYCVLPTHQARHLPDGQSFEDGACLGVPAVTAHRALFSDGDITDQTILVTGGSGRVGRYAVQMAKHAGATVIATAGSAEKVEHVRSLGADHVFNYKSDDILSEVAEITNGSGVDRIVDVALTAHTAEIPALVKENGVVTAYSMDHDPNPRTPLLALMHKNITLRPFTIYGMPQEAKNAAFAYVEKLTADGALTHLIGARFAFGEVDKAHECVEQKGLFGVCLIHIGE
jgi:NADPH2:quinone reductase